MYLVGLVRGSGGSLALLAGCELRKVAVVVTLPASRQSALRSLTWYARSIAAGHSHLMVEDLALARLRLRDQALVEHIEHILADTLKLLLDLLTVGADDVDMLVGALSFLFLLDAADDAPRGTARADHVLVGDGEEVALVDRELATDLEAKCQYPHPLEDAAAFGRLSRGRGLAGVIRTFATS